MGPLLLVMAGGAVGAGARWGVSRLWPAAPGAWPWATLAVNLSGGLLIGVLAGALLGRGAEPARLALGVGALGGFTTFSTFSLEVVALLERGAWGAGLGYALASTAGAVLACALGLIAGRSLA